MDAQKDYYKILGVSLNASQSEILAAYRARVIQTQVDTPDACSDRTFLEVREAFEVIGQPHSRAAYDAEHHQHLHRLSGMGDPRSVDPTHQPDLERKLREEQAALRRQLELQLADLEARIRQEPGVMMWDRRRLQWELRSRLRRLERDCAEADAPAAARLENTVKAALAGLAGTVRKIRAQ